MAWACVMLVLLSGTARAEGDEHLGVSRGLPITIDDADKIEAGKSEVKFHTLYDRQRDGSNLFTPRAEFEYGLRRGLSLGVSPSYSLGNADQRNRGAVEFELEYNILEFSGWRPGITIVPQVSVPYGSGGEAVQSEIELRVTQPLGESKTAPRLHLNLSWRHLHDPKPDERQDRYFAAAGINFAVAQNTALAFDLVREPERERGKVDNFVEAGVRHTLGESLALNAGAGVGLGPDSPRFRLLVGLQAGF